jgi:hypothetical protein
MALHWGPLFHNFRLAMTLRGSAAPIYAPWRIPPRLGRGTPTREGLWQGLRDGAADNAMVGRRAANLAPLLGDVLTIRKPLACYRIHEGNYAALGSLESVKFRRRLLQDVEKARLFVTVSRQLRLPVPRDP